MYVFVYINGQSQLKAAYCLRERQRRHFAASSNNSVRHPYGNACYQADIIKTLQARQNTNNVGHSRMILQPLVTTTLSLLK